MVQTLMAELRVLIGKRAPSGTPPPSPQTPQAPYTRRDLKANLHRHMSIVLDRIKSSKDRFYSSKFSNLCNKDKRHIKA
ncbi:unnamed protein product [Pieris brassicae]|uniref:Uncharacterized protein n=1 Tax=Pieris brassicae TaxID=7116 RepID=A0A9P0X3S1_PIEBR|nr:unnamed protein product [Pieris brassicae]